MPQLWPPTRFWQFWAIAGMAILTMVFWWGVEGSVLHASGRATDAVADGLLRFSLLILNPALILGWLGAFWLRLRIGDRGYWQMLGLIAMVWAIAVLLVQGLLS